MIEKILNKKWILAKDKSHEYMLKKNYGDLKEFDDIVRFINENGREGYFFKKKYKYYYHSDYKYWTMSEAGIATLINRAKIKN